MQHFCVEAGTVIEIYAQATVENTGDNVMLSVMNSDEDNNVQILAQAAANDAMAPTSVSLVYYGIIDVDTEMMVCITAQSADRIVPKKF